MRVANVTTNENLLDVIRKLDRRQLDLQQQISDGQKITLPEDDGMKMGRLVRMESEKSSLVQYQRNSSYAKEYLDATHLNLDKLRELSIRSQELARTSGAGQFLVAQQTNAHEMNEILEEALNRINATHRKKALFGGTHTKPKFGSTDVIHGQRYEKKLSFDDNYVPKNLQVGDKFTVKVAGLGPYVVDAETIIPGTPDEKVGTSVDVATYLRDKINDDSRKTGIEAKLDLENNLVLYGAVDEDFEFSAVYESTPDSEYVFPNDPERQTSRTLPFTKSGSTYKLSKTTAAINETLRPGDEYIFKVAGRTYEVSTSTVINTGTGALAETATDVLDYLRAQIENDFAGVMTASINASGELVVSRLDSQDFEISGSLETTFWRRTLHVDAPKVPEATTLSLSHPENWQRLTSYSQGDLIYYNDKVWESQYDQNFNHIPDTNMASAWKEIDSTYDGEREDWNLSVAAHEHRQYHVTPDGWLFETLTDAQNHVIDALNQNADLETPQETLDKIFSGVREVTMSVAQFEVTGSHSAAARVSFDPRTLEYRLTASATGENMGGSKIIGFKTNELGTGGITQSNYSEDDVFVYNGQYYKAKEGVPAGFDLSQLPSTAGDSSVSFYNLGTRLPSAGYNEVLISNRDQNLLKGEYLHDLPLNRFYLVLEDFSTGGSTTSYNPSTDVRLEEIDVYESPQGLDWNQGRTYNKDDVVYYNNRYWQCLQDNFDNLAFDPIDLVDYYVVHPDDEFTNNSDGDRVQNDAWLAIGESFGHVAKFRADRTDWPQVIIAPPTRGGEGAEAEAVVDAGGNLVGLRLTNAGNYTFEDEMPQSAIVRTTDGNEITVEVLGDNGKVFGFQIDTEKAKLDLPTSPRLDDTFSFATGKQTFLTHRNETGEVIDVTYNGNEKNADAYVGKDSKISYYLNAANGGTQELGNVVDAMIDLRDALRTATPSTYAADVEAADQALIALEDKVVDKMGEVASKMARIEAVHNHDEAYYMSLNKRIAADIDVDLSEAIIRMTRATNAYQAAIQVGAHIMKTSLLNFL